MTLIPLPIAVVSWRHVCQVTMLCECGCKSIMLESRFYFSQTDSLDCITEFY